jgi:hypothetical protein
VIVVICSQTVVYQSMRCVDDDVYELFKDFVMCLLLLLLYGIRCDVCYVLFVLFVCKLLFLFVLSTIEFPSKQSEKSRHLS